MLKTQKIVVTGNSPLALRSRWFVIGFAGTTEHTRNALPDTK